MRSERVALGPDPARLASELRARVPAPETVSDQVAEILAAVRAGGDAALRDYTQRWDTGGREPPPVRVEAAELERAGRRMAPELRRSLALAAQNVERVAQAALCEERTVSFEGHEVLLRQAPVDRAAVYVPGGRAPYPSTVVMGAVTARAAGVRELVVCAPPGAQGDVHPAVLGACWLVGTDVVYRVGGAQAIAALAYGTETVAPADVIVGPGNLYVQEAKRQLSGRVGTEGFAGPSDVMVIAGAGAPAELVALDLLAQAEHGAGTLVVAVSSSSGLLDQVARALGQGAETGAVAVLVDVDGAEPALALAQALAPEHLELVGAEMEALAPLVTRAGCLFVGAGGGTAFGDYIAGSNHVLPTAGAARFASGLSPAHFRRAFCEVRIRAGAAALARAAAPLARSEGFEQHARSMEARIRDNG